MDFSNVLYSIPFDIINSLLMVHHYGDCVVQEYYMS